MARPGRPRKADPKAESLSWLIRDHDDEAAKKLLLEIGVDAQDGYARTALLWSVVHQNEEISAWLVAHKANLNHQDRNGYTALHFAAQGRRGIAAHLLFENGADPNVADSHGNIPLWTAIINSKGDWELVKLYLAKGANPDSINRYQNTPRRLATETFNVNLEDL